MDAPCVKCDSELEKVQPYNYLNVWARVIAIARRSCPGNAYFELKGRPHEPPGNMPSPLDSLGTNIPTAEPTLTMKQNSGRWQNINIKNGKLHDQDPKQEQACDRNSFQAKVVKTTNHDQAKTEEKNKK